MDIMAMSDMELLPYYVVGGIIIILLGGVIGTKIANYLNKRDASQKNNQSKDDKFSPD